MADEKARDYWLNCFEKGIDVVSFPPIFTDFFTCKDAPFKCTQLSLLLMIHDSSTFNLFHCQVFVFSSQIKHFRIIN